MTTQLTLSDKRTYLYASLFTLGNILVPQLCHLIPQGGLILLPIYFFTLIAAYRFGLFTGMLTAICSPLVNHLFFGMPPLAALPILLIKSSLLAIFAALIAKRVGKVTLGALVLTVLAYQFAGACFEWPMTGSLMHALQDIRLGYPGILVQIFGGYLLLRRLES